jgi:hypothetical protein
MTDIKNKIKKWQKERERKRKQKQLDKAFYKRQEQLNIRKRQIKSRGEVDSMRFEGYQTAGMDVIEPSGRVWHSGYKKGGKKKRWWK